MAQIKVYGLEDNLNTVKEKLSDVIHSCIIDAFQMPENKRFHRFFPLKKKDFYFPKDRTEKYTIIEISVFEGRTIEGKKKLISLLFERIEKQINILPNDIEITIFETPKHNWGIRGQKGDELSLNYNVKV